MNLLKTMQNAMRSRNITTGHAAIKGDIFSDKNEARFCITWLQSVDTNFFCDVNYFVPVPSGYLLNFNPFHWRIQGGAPGTRAPPGGPNSFIFMQFSAKNWKIIALLGVGAPPWGKSWIRHCIWHLQSVDMKLCFKPSVVGRLPCSCRYSNMCDHWRI